MPDHAAQYRPAPPSLAWVRRGLLTLVGLGLGACVMAPVADYEIGTPQVYAQVYASNYPPSYSVFSPYPAYGFGGGPAYVYSPSYFLSPPVWSFSVFGYRPARPPHWHAPHVQRPQRPAGTHPFRPGFSDQRPRPPLGSRPPAQRPHPPAAGAPRPRPDGLARPPRTPDRPGVQAPFRGEVGHMPQSPAAAQGQQKRPALTRPPSAQTPRRPQVRPNPVRSQGAARPQGRNTSAPATQPRSSVSRAPGMSGALRSIDGGPAREGAKGRMRP